MRRMTKVGFKRRIPYRKERVKKTKILRKRGNRYKRPISPLFIIFTVALYRRFYGYQKWLSFSVPWKLVSQSDQLSGLYHNMMANIWELDSTPPKKYATFRLVK